MKTIPFASGAIGALLLATTTTAEAQSREGFALKATQYSRPSRSS